MTTQQHSPNDRFDEALSDRLAKLSGMPVDTNSLDRALKAEIPPPERNPWRAWRPLIAVAASLLLAFTLILALQGGEARATPTDMVRMHQDIVAGKVHVMPADTIEDVNKMLAAFSSNTLSLPQPPESHVMACCLRDVKDKKVACVLLKADGVPITMAVADVDAVQTKGTISRDYHGRHFHVQIEGNLTMVMLDERNHHVCLIGELSAEKLMALTDGMKF